MDDKEAMERVLSGEENIYQHKCLTCGELFLEKGKFAFTCDKCTNKSKEKSKSR